MDRSKVRVAVSWFFIIAAIVIIQITIYRRSSSTQTADMLLNMNIQITGKYFIGVRQLAGQNPMLEKTSSQLHKSIQSILWHNKYLSGIPILAEISGRDAALQKLKRMTADPDMVTDGENLPVFYQLYQDGSVSLDSQQINVLKGYGWIGRLALSQDKPDTDPERKTVLNSASRMVMIVGLMIIMVVAALVGGLVLLIIAIVQGINGKLRSHLVIPESPGTLLLETFAIYLVLSIVMPLLLLIIMLVFSNGVIGDGGLLMAVLAGLLPILWPLLRGAGWRDYRTALGWHRGKGIFREVGAGIVGYITGLPFMILALIVVMILARYAGETPSHPAVFALGRRPLLLFLLVCVYAPFAEETMFRGVFYVYLRRFLPWAISGIITGLIFASLHPQGWVAVPLLGVIGFNLSAIREWRGSAIAPMTAHALNNGSAVLIIINALA
ncbi:MAG: type II CAAX endopeptidase family protein [Desulfobacteraceae bacterium]